MIVAMGILAGVFLVVVALLTSLLRGTQKEADRTAGNILAERVMTERLQEIFADETEKINFFDTESPPEEPLEGTVALNNSVFTYRITHTTLTDPGGNLIGGDAASSNRVKKLDTVVWWWSEDPNEARAGYGYLRTEATRLVNERTNFDIDS
jgi:hypothetical protein